MNNTFIIVTWNSAGQITALLDSIAQYEPNSAVIVVDNHSADHTVEKVAQYKPIKVRLLALHENVGFAKANNIAFKSVHTKYVTFINPDTRLTTPVVEKIAKKLMDQVGMIGVRLENTDGTLQPSVFNFQTPSSILIEQFALGKVFPEWWRIKHSPENSQLNQEMTVDWVIGAFVFTKASYYEQVGGFSEDYFMYSEDMDLCYKYHQAGYQVLFTPDVTLIHAGGSSEKQTGSSKNLKLLRSFCTFARKSGHLANIRTLYYSYLIKEKVFHLVDQSRAARYRENVQFLQKQLELIKK